MSDASRPADAVRAGPTANAEAPATSRGAGAWAGTLVVAYGIAVFTVDALLLIGVSLLRRLPPFVLLQAEKMTEGDDVAPEVVRYIQEFQAAADALAHGVAPGAWSGGALGLVLVVVGFTLLLGRAGAPRAVLFVLAAKAVHAAIVTLLFAFASLPEVRAAWVAFAATSARLRSAGGDVPAAPDLPLGTAPVVVVGAAQIALCSLLAWVVTRPAVTAWCEARSRGKSALPH